MKRKIIFKTFLFNDSFICSFYDLETDQIKNCVISRHRNDIIELLTFYLYSAKDCVWIGYNNLERDFQFIKGLSVVNLGQTSVSYSVLMSILRRIEKDLADGLFDNSKNQISQIDLMKINHFGYKSKLVTLESARVYLNYSNIYYKYISPNIDVNDDNIHYIEQDIKLDLETIKDLYNLTIGNTDNSQYKNSDKILLRQQLQKRFNVGCLNDPDVKLGERILLKLYSYNNSKEFLRTQSNNAYSQLYVDFNKFIPSWVKFKNQQFNQIKEYLESYSGHIDSLQVDITIPFQNISLKYRNGGLHSTTNAGIYKTDEEMIIVEQDVVSLYPHLVKLLQIYPQKLTKEFVDIYVNTLLNERVKELQKPKEEQDKTIVEGYKKACVSIIGKTNEQNSLLYDQIFYKRIIFTGQLFASKWIDILTSNIPNLEMVFVNTDGICFKMPKRYLDNLSEITKKIEEYFGFSIKTNYLCKLIIKDINNYIMLYDDNTVKQNGLFEVDREIYKDYSPKIIRIALTEYFINNIPVKTTIMNNKNIFNFCTKINCDENMSLTYCYVDNGVVRENSLPQMNRYYVSNSGGSILKKGENIISGNRYNVTLFNDVFQSDNYDINYAYYILECNKIIDKIEIQQLSLFE